MVSFKISIVRLPPGIATFTSSPTCLPIRARPIGELVEISPFGRIGFFACHQLVGDLFVFRNVENMDRRPKSHAISRNLVHIDQRETLQAFASVARVGHRRSAGVLWRHGIPRSHADRHALAPLRSLLEVHCATRIPGPLFLPVAFSLTLPFLRPQRLHRHYNGR